MKKVRDTRSMRLTRREAIRFLGVGAGLGAVAACGREADPSAPAAQQSATGTSPLRFPSGAIIRTVLKDLDPHTLTGTILAHEHLTNALRLPGTAPDAPPRPAWDELDWMVEEVKATKQHGVSCIVAAALGIPKAEVPGYLKQLSERSGVHIILGSSYYMRTDYPPEDKTRTEDQIADELVRSATALGAGLFGEIGVANGESEIAPDEQKAFRATGKAHVRTGIPILSHNNYSTGPNVPMDMLLRELDLFESVGVKPQSVALGHVCCLDDPKAEMAQQAAKRGAFVAFDRLTRQQQWVTDEKRLAMILAFLEAGYVDQLLLSSDFTGSVPTASAPEKEFRSGPFHAHEGGPGWARSVFWFHPMLRKAGVNDETLRRILEDNPRRFLAFVPKTT